MSVFNSWKSYVKNNADLMKQALKRIESYTDLSKGVREIVSKALNN